MKKLLLMPINSIVLLILILLLLFVPFGIGVNIALSHPLGWWTAAGVLINISGAITAVAWLFYRVDNSLNKIIE